MMGFYNAILPKLYPGKVEDEYFYQRMMVESLNAYLKDMHNAWFLPCVMVEGTIVTFSTPPSTVPLTGELATIANNYFEIPLEAMIEIYEKRDYITYFPSIFKLFGEYFAKNFCNIKGYSTLNGVSGIAAITTTNFEAMGEAFIENVKSMGSAMNPEIFHQTMETYLKMAISEIPPINIPMMGTATVPYSNVPYGTFTGTAILTFSTIIPRVI